MTIWRTVLVLVGGHLLLGLSLLVMEATHGINDQDAGFAAALVFHGLNYPTSWILRSVLGTPPGIPAVVAAGIVQWAVIGWLAGAAWRTADGS